ncbi:LamB/YcsF family protein [Nakamurella sp. YIM 132084]|uniref:LamB/YcsF family protein n=1 Tax=Nakamurella leprariae TaxID=2803911 RepID=A0A939BZH5_9ACTN|nr:LamB/YcsF family protein [Nakamurella leprariae]
MALNSDVGEGFGAWSFGDDDAILDGITAANVACGFHAGDPAILRRTCARAAARGVSIGAQVSYRDLAGFGRRFVDVDATELVDDLLYQIGALRMFAELAGSTVGYVKAHGALYNTAARHTEHAAAIVEAAGLAGGLPVVCQPGTAVWRRTVEAGLVPVAEVFADRAYTPDGLLVRRALPGAVLTDPDQVAERAVTMLTTGTVPAISGETVRFTEPPATLCVHSDTPGAAAIVAAVRAALTAAGIPLTGIGTTAGTGTGIDPGAAEAPDGPR